MKIVTATGNEVRRGARFSFLSKVSLLLALFILIPNLASLSASTAQASSVDVWWPTDGSHMQGLQPFKAMIPGLDVSQYQMFWQVDGGGLVPMPTSNDNSPHKEAEVDLSGWTWHGNGPYNVNFVAKQNGNVIAQQQETIYNDGVSGGQSQPQHNVMIPAPTQPSQPAQTVTLSAPTVSVQSSQNVSIDSWWPVADATMSGTQPFKAMIPGLDVSQYQMFWQVDGGGLVPMPTSNDNSPHKEAEVDLSGWTWHGNGPYNVNFVAKDNSGNVIAQLQIPIYVGQTASSDPAPAPAQTQSQTQTQSQSQSQSSPIVGAPVQMAQVAGDPLSGEKLWVNPSSDASNQEAQWQSSNPTGAAAMQVLASQPTAQWFGDWNSNIQNDVHNAVSTAASQGSVPVLVAYNIPERDCNGYSGGGASSPSAYTSWIQGLAAGIGSNKAVVILEPDALALMSCLSQSDQQTRMQLLSSAVSTLKQNPNTTVYIDAGHSNWIDAGTMANDLKQAGVGQADGFSLNVSNFMATQDEITYGTQVSQNLGGKHFVIDTSRNGNGSNGQWCNPTGAAIGQKSTTSTGNSLVDAFLWVKTPGESDGNCNGGPNAGVWWPDYALSLVQNAH